MTPPNPPTSSSSVVNTPSTVDGSADSGCGEGAEASYAAPGLNKTEMELVQAGSEGLAKPEAFRSMAIY